MANANTTSKTVMVRVEKRSFLNLYIRRKNLALGGLWMRLTYGSLDGFGSVLKQVSPKWGGFGFFLPLFRDTAEKNYILTNPSGFFGMRHPLLNRFQIFGEVCFFTGTEIEVLFLVVPRDNIGQGSSRAVMEIGCMLPDSF